MRFSTTLGALTSAAFALGVSAGASVASSPSNSTSPGSSSSSSSPSSPSPSSPSSSSSPSTTDNLPAYLPGANITTSGNGCPQSGADGKYLSADGSFLEMDFVLHNFTAVYGGGNSPSLRSTACEVHIDTIDAPAGWQVSPTNFSAGGFAVLEPGTTLTVFFTVFWSNNASDTLSFSKQYQNNANGTVTSLAVFTQEAQELWSPCAGSDGTLPTLNIDYRAAFTSSVVNPDGSVPFAYFGPLFVLGQEQYHVTEDVTYAWRACTAPS